MRENYKIRTQSSRTQVMNQSKEESRSPQSERTQVVRSLRGGDSTLRVLYYYELTNDEEISTCGNSTLGRRTAGADAAMRMQTRRHKQSGAETAPQPCIPPTWERSGIEEILSRSKITLCSGEAVRLGICGARCAWGIAGPGGGLFKRPAVHMTSQQCSAKHNEAVFTSHTSTSN
ncbi:hypothetical protein DFH09DRAFT_1086160 [Mycena vulgaris]|nr:hypothetical protein DFH09DRAFT_1086160 [Mycena vulgaris]